MCVSSLVHVWTFPPAARGGYCEEPGECLCREGFTGYWCSEIVPTDTPVTTSPTDTPVTTSPTDTPVTTSPTDTPVTTSPTDIPVTTSPTNTPASTTSHATGTPDMITGTPDMITGTPDVTTGRSGPEVQPRSDGWSTITLTVPLVYGLPSRRWGH